MQDLVVACRRAEELTNLPSGWNSYNAASPSLLASCAAIDLMTAIHTHSTSLGAPLVPEVIPMSHGGLSLEYQYSGRELEIAVNNDGEIEEVVLDFGDVLFDGLPQIICEMGVVSTGELMVRVREVITGKLEDDHGT